MKNVPDPVRHAIDYTLRQDRGRLIAALVASIGDFELAEESLQEASIAALADWATNGIPKSRRGWLLQVARRKAIDHFRRNARFRAREPEMARLAAEDEMDANKDAPDIPDKRLALIFTCCHPALDAKSRIALTLRTVGGLKTPEIARAFLDKETTMGQRLSRARKKITLSGIPFAVPGSELWDERLASVLSVIYLIFNEGYVASSGEKSVRVDLCDEAIFLARLLDQLRGNDPEILGILSLMLTTQARAPGRLGPVTVPLDEQDRTLWDSAMITEGQELLETAMVAGEPGPYQIKAAISCLHGAAQKAQDTDWAQIVMLYDSLLRFEPSPVVELNRAVALAEVGQVTAALADIERLATELPTYQPFHAALARYAGQLGDFDAALVAYDRAIELAGNNADRHYLKAQKHRLVS